MEFLRTGLYCVVVVAVIIFAVMNAVSAQLCSTRQSFNGTQLVFSQCQALGTQSASIAWSLHPASNTVNISFSGEALSASGWVGWGLNPRSLLMAGTSALIAFSDASGNVVMLDYKLTPAVVDETSSLSPGPFDLVVLNRAVEQNGTQFRMFATLQLNPNQTAINLIWNRGPGVFGNSPEPHSTLPTDLETAKSIDLSSGIVIGGGTAPHQHLKNMHGLLAAVSWGVLLPLGAMVARYFRSLDPAWFYLHVTIQSIAYVLAVSAWGLGLRLGHYSAGVVYHQHRSIGITLFCFATLQVLAIVLRPGKEHKIRVYWNIYHQVIGFTTIILAAINIFKGFNILQPGSGWREAYIAILSTMGGISVILEVITWWLFMSKKLRKSSSRSLERGDSDAALRNGASTAIRVDRREVVEIEKW